LRSKDQQPQNVVERNRTKGASPTAVSRNPSRRKAAKQLPFVMRRLNSLLFHCLFVSFLIWKIEASTIEYLLSDNFLQFAKNPLFLILVFLYLFLLP